LWKGDKNLIGKVDQQNMSVHRWFANKSCPGDYLYERHGYIADEVNKRLGASATPTPTTPTPAPTAYKVGDIVQFTSGAVYTSSNAPAPAHSRGKSRCKVTQVYNGKHPYHLISEDGGNVYGWVDAIDISPISGGTTPTGKIEKGSKVKIKAGAKYYGGQTIPGWVTSDTWIVCSLSGDRAVLGKNVSGKNDIQSPIKVADLVLA
jgi:hypothetical protein